MSKLDIVRAWKDAEYRQSLSVEERALLPRHPADSVELADEDLPQAAGGTATNLDFTAGCCPNTTPPITLTLLFGSICTVTILAE